MVKKIVIRHEEIQIVFKSDPNLKDAALEKAKNEGMTLKAVLCMAMKAYVNDEMVLGMWRNEEQYEADDDDVPKVKASRSTHSTHSTSSGQASSGQAKKKMKEVSKNKKVTSTKKIVSTIPTLKKKGTKAV
jgi:hypothetical protein